ncbi:MAG: hypothetical protein V3V13_06130 [Paracoccaceae bacterium]
MKNVLIATITTLSFATTALAFEEGVDADGDGMLSAAEMVAVYPNITEEVYAAVDTDGDGAISEEELAAAIEKGLLES